MPEIEVTQVYLKFQVFPKRILGLLGSIKNRFDNLFLFYSHFFLFFSPLLFSFFSHLLIKFQQLDCQEVEEETKKNTKFIL